MSKIEIKGLEGLKGISALSSEEYNNLRSRYKEQGLITDYSPDSKVDRLYRNKLFVDKFGKDLFKTMSATERDSYYQESLTNEYTQNRYGNDSNYFEIENLTPEGKLDLVEKGYLSDEEIEKQYQDNIKSANNIEDNKLVQFIQDFVNLGNPSMSTNMFEESPLKEGFGTLKEGQLKAKRDLLDSVIAEDNERKREMVSNESLMLQSELQKGLNNGDLTKEDIDKQFEEIAGGMIGSNHYKAFKDSEELKNFSVTDKIELLSNYITITKRFGNVMDGLSNLESEMKNYISKNQDGLDWAANTFKNVAVGGVAHLMNYRMSGLAMKHAAEGDLEQWLQGKDKDGNELDIWNNPLYWQGVDQFNTFDANEIKKARANGGISKYQNITRAGEEMDFFSWHSMNEAIKQGKYLWSDALVGILLGGVGSNISKSLEPISKTLSKNFSRISTLGTVLATGMPNAESEGLNTFQNTLQSANAEIDKLVDKELETDINNILNSEEGKKNLSDIENQLKTLYSSPEYRNSYISEENIKEQALQTYKNNLRTQLKPSIEEAHKADRIQAEKSAALAYINTATVSELKTSLTNAAFRKVLFNKETRDMLRGNNTGFIGLEDGTVGVQRMSKWTKYGRPAINPLGEFVDEFFDSVINNYGQGVGLSDFNNYIKKKYDPVSYKSFYDNALGNFLGGLDRATDTMLEKEAYYEGFLGLLGGGVNVTPNIGGVWNLLTSKEAREDLKNQTFLEKINNYISNPIISDIADNIREEREAQIQVDEINKVLNEHRSDLEDMGALASTMGAWDESIKDINQMDALDDKQADIFSTMYVLNTLSRSPIATQSSLYQNAMSTLEELANDKMSEEELSELVDSFLGIGDNKSVASRPDAIEEAKSRLKKNAQAMLDMKSTIDEMNSMLDSSPNAALITSDVRAELAFLKMRNQNWRKRLSEIQENLGTSSNESKVQSVYGSKRAINNKLKSLNEYANSLRDELSSIETQRTKATEDLKSNDKEVVGKAKHILASLSLYEQSVNEKMEKLSIEQRKLNTFNNNLENEFTETLSEEDILRLHPEDRAHILDPRNLSDYSQEQQAIIKTTINNLKLKDPALIQQIQDAAELSRRVEDVSNAFAKIADNPIEASDYFDLMRQYRNEAFSYLVREKAKGEVSKMFEGKTDDEIKSIAKNLPTIALDDYIKAHPEHKDIIEQVKEVAQLRQDARLVIDELAKDKGLNIAIKQSIINLTEDANNKEEAINSIEEAIDNDAIDDTTREYLDTILQKLEKLSYQRNATRVQERKNKVEREAKLKEERKKEEDKKKKAEEEAKKSVEAKKNESKIVPVEEPLDEEPTNIPTEETLIENTLEVVSLDSPSLEEQAKEDSNVTIIESPKANKEETENSNTNIMEGNFFFRYNRSIGSTGIQTKAKGAKEGDSMNSVFDWLDSAGVQYQKIIDYELHNILTKDTKIHFMMLNHLIKTATNDQKLNKTVFNVIEYTPEVARKHNEEYGGVVEANGKKWLIIGILGYRNEGQRSFYGPLEYSLRERRNPYFQSNKSERFYVDPDYYTEVTQIGTGWITRQLDSDTEVKLRSIQELLNSSERNPRGLKLEDLKWGIQQGGKFATVGISHRNKISTPVDIVPNLGNTFLMVEGANGKFVPVAIRPTMYTELKKGALTDEINTLLMELTSTNHKERLEARIKLASLLYLKDSENTILIGSPTSNTLSIKKNGNIIKTFNLDDPTFNAQEYIRYVEMLNPRVNITTGVLSSPITLKKYDEAGALMTDIAILGTSNADFSVKGVGIDGKPVNNSNVNNETNVNTNSGLTKARGRSFNYQGTRYRYRNGNYYTLEGVIISDPRTQEQLHYTRILAESKMSPAYSKDSYDYYVINEDRDNPIVIKKDRNSGMIITSNKEQALKILNIIADKKKKENAEKATAKIVQVSPLSDVSLAEELINEVLSESEQSTSSEVTQERDENPEISNDEDINTTGTKSLAELQEDRNTDSFLDILCSEEYGDVLDELIQEKIDSKEWTNVPTDLNELSKYLQDKGIAVTGIQNVESWINMIRDCK